MESTIERTIFSRNIFSTTFPNISSSADWQLWRHGGKRKVLNMHLPLVQMDKRPVPNGFPMGLRLGIRDCCFSIHKKNKLQIFMVQVVLILQQISNGAMSPLLNNGDFGLICGCKLRTICPRHMTPGHCNQDKYMPVANHPNFDYVIKRILQWSCEKTDVRHFLQCCYN